jgi:anti-sigma factor RsiW
MSGGFEISEAELHAFVDGALDAERLRTLEAKVAADPALAQRVAAFRSDKEMLKRVFTPLIDRPIPKEWLAMARGSAPPARRAMSWRLVGSIAAAVILFVAGTIAYQEQRSPRSNEIVQAALDARGQAREGKDITVQADANTAQYDAALSATVASHVKVPDLGRMGYRLAAIRLYPKSPGDGAAELLYRDGGNRLFTLYLRRSGGTARFDQFERNGLRVCVWQDEELSTVMAGNVSTAAMQRLASLAYTGLTL